MFNKYTIMISTILMMVFSTTLVAGDTEHHRESPEVQSKLHLSTDIRQLLSEEMRAVQDGMVNLVMAIPKGNWNEIDAIATQIKESYIMQQKLSEKQREALHHSLPQGFQVLDHGFHETAARLSHAAKQHDAQLVTFYFYKLSESCTLCHSTYARHKFPNFDKH